MSWWAYVKEVAGATATLDEIGEAAGVKGSTVSRWSKGAGVDPITAATFARSHGRPVLEAFLAADYLTPAEAGAGVEVDARIEHTLADASDADLLAELSRRMGGRMLPKGAAREADRLTRRKT